MRAIDILMIAIVLLAILLLISNHYHTYGDFSLSTSSISKTDSKSIIINQKEMLALERANQRLKNENVTISRKTLVDDNRIISSLTDLIKSKDFQIEELLNQLEELKSLQSQKEELILLNISNSIESASSSVNTNPDSSLPSKKYSLDVEDVELQKHCEAKFGVSLIDNWQACKEIWCGASSNSNTNSKTSENTSNKDNLNSGAKTQSELRCYPYHQLHKQNDGRGPDMFCEATNFMIDFSKVHGKASGSKPHLGAQYHSFDMGSLQGNCHITNKYRSELFMPHHALQMRSFQANTSLSADLEVVDHPVYLLARDEDCENTFHHTADLMNIFLVMSALGLSRDDGMQIALFDLHPDGPYSQFLTQVYAPKHPIIRAANFGDKKILFRRLIFHLESPAGLIFPKVTLPDPNRCWGPSLFQAYRRHVLHSLDLWDVTPPPIPTVTLTLRHRTPEKNVGRVLGNEEEVVELLRRGTMINLHVVDFAKMTFLEQIKLVRQTNVLIGIHGAGLMLIMFAAEEAVLVEVHPSYRQDRHFRHAARMTGKSYMALRARQRESCHGSSDSIIIPLDEFQATVDGAVRLARTFDGGLVECGLVCPTEILALDPRLNSHYKPHEKRGSPIDTSFPCG